jgi:hypothetical protein
MNYNYYLPAWKKAGRFMNVRLFLTLIPIIFLLFGCLLTLGPETEVVLTITLDDVIGVGVEEEESWSIYVTTELNEEEYSIIENEPVEIICSSWDRVIIRFRVNENVMGAQRRGRGTYSVYAGRVLNEGPLSVTREVTAHQLIGNQPDVDWRFAVTLSAAER